MKKEVFERDYNSNSNNNYFFANMCKNNIPEKHNENKEITLEQALDVIDAVLNQEQLDDMPELEEQEEIIKMIHYIDDMLVFIRKERQHIFEEESNPV